MTISLNISKNQKDSGLNSLLLGQQTGQSADFDSQFDGELSSQLSSDRQDLAAATHGYDDYQQQHASKPASANMAVAMQATDTAAAQAPEQVSTADQAKAVATKPLAPNEDSVADDLLEESAPAQGDMLLAVISQSQAIKQLQSKTPQPSQQVEPIAEGSQPALPTTSNPNVDVTTESPATELAANVLANAAGTATPTTSNTNTPLADVPLKFRKLVQKPQQPADPKPQVDQATSAKTNEPQADDLALDAVSYWQLRQQQKDQTNTAATPTAAQLLGQPTLVTTNTQLTTDAAVEQDAGAPDQTSALPLPTTDKAAAETKSTATVQANAAVTSKAVADAMRSDKGAALLATALETESAEPVSETAPTIEQPVMPIKALNAETDAVAAEQSESTAATEHPLANQTASTAQSSTPAAQQTNAPATAVAARPPQSGAPVQKRSLLPSDVAIDPAKPEQGATKPTEVAGPVIGSSETDKVAVAPSRVSGERKAALQPVAEVVTEEKPTSSPIRVPLAEAQATETSSGAVNELTVQASDAAQAATPTASAAATTAVVTESSDKVKVDAPTFVAQQAAAAPVSVLPEPVTPTEPQWIAAEAVTATAVADATKTPSTVNERPATTEAKPTYAEFMQQSNQQQGEQQAQQQHKEQPALARQLDNAVAATTEPASVVRSATLDTAANATPGTAATPTTPLVHATSIATHVNKLTETLKTADVAPQQLPLDLQQPNTATKLAERVMYQVHQKIQSAEVQLHPEDLGAMQIKVSLQQDQLSVQFVVQQGAAKEALEQQMPRLKDMLQQQGMQLADGQVEQRQSQQGEQRQAQNQRGTAATAADDAETGNLLQQGQVQVKVSDRAVDYYA